MAGLALPYLLPEVKNPDLQYKKYLNFLLALMSRRAGNLRVNSKPFDISINPSTACQLHCPHCQTGNGRMDRPAVNMSPELHRHMISGVVDELFIIRYFGTGESLLNKRFTELLKQIEGKEIFTFITSNLSLKFTDQQIDDLIHSGLNVLGVSLDGAEQTTYGQYRVGGSHELVVTNMLRIIKRRNQLGLKYPLVQWRYLVFKHNEHEVPRVRELAKQYAVDLLEFVQGCAPKDGKSAVQPVDKFDVHPSMSGPALHKAMKEKDTILQRLLKQRKFEHRLPPNELKFKKCDWHYVGSYWYPDGGVGPCCHPTHIPDDFGTVTLENSFEDIWNGQRYQDARALIRDNKKTDNFCARCAGKAIMDRFFVTSMRGILLNAPEWVLKILSLKPQLFFCPVDDYYMHAEIQTIVEGHHQFVGEHSSVKKRLQSLRDADAASKPSLMLLVELLEQ
jgi:MoaA/NifB/PqqE/SkfB family radical SAM enzyme